MMIQIRVNVYLTIYCVSEDVYFVDLSPERDLQIIMETLMCLQSLLQAVPFGLFFCF